jgi:uncharacterized repeat protein (TIGR01451 family)
MPIADHPLRVMPVRSRAGMLVRMRSAADGWRGGAEAAGLGSRGRRAAVVLVVVVVGWLAGLPAVASADRGYTAVFSENRQGDITGTGNTLMSCFDSDPRCKAARDGTASGTNLNNNGLPMDWVDVDGDPDTFDSSAATLSLPVGAHVLFARLYYTGRLQQGDDSGSFSSRPAPDPSRRNKVLFKPPGRGAYLTLTAQVVDDATDSQTKLAREYQGIVDVTDIVAAAGAGEYTVANVQLGTGLNADQAGGWALAVAYEDVNQPSRNLTIFDGFRFVLADGPPVDIALSGFQTPPSGPVTTNIGLVAIEGDLGTTGDSATLNAGTQQAFALTNAGNPANNFFNASITDRRGTRFALRRPAYVNEMGFDADIINATGRLQNGQASTVIRLATSGDGFAPNAVSFATDLFAPSLKVDKTVEPAGDAHLGDVLTYTVDVSNTGLDAATNVVLTDPIPGGTSYVPGSLVVAGGANAGAKSDAVGDDQAEFDATGNKVVFRLGSGANATAGGRLEVPARAPANATEIQFKVKVAASGLPSGFRVVNTAGVGFLAETLGISEHVDSPDVVTPVRVPDLTIAKRHTGEFRPGRSVPFELVVSNVGDAATIAKVTVTDTLASELTFATQPAGDGWDCAATSGRALSCERTDTLAPGDAYPPIRYVAQVARTAPAGDLINTATVKTPGDGDPTNDSDTNTGPLVRPLVDMAIRKFAVTPISFPGRGVRFVLLVGNIGPNVATDVTVRDILPRGLTAIRLRPTRGTCVGTVCHLGTMAPGEHAAIAVLAIAGRDTGGRRLRDVAVVRARQREVTRRNNADDAVVRIIRLVDLEVTKTTASPTAPAGNPVSFVVVVQNNGPSTATNVQVTDQLPAPLTLISGTPLQGTCTGLTCDLGTLKSGEATQIVFEAASDPSVAGQTLTNTVRVRAREPELLLANNLATSNVAFTAVLPGPAPSLTVTKTVDAPQVVVGGLLTYRIVVTNTGLGPADAVLVTDTPDPGLQIVSVTPSQGTCSATVPLSCQLDALAPGAGATVTVVALVTAPGSLRNGATAIPSTGGGGGDVADATASSPKVTLTKRASPTTVRPGDEVSYTLAVTNHGPGAATAIQVCDDLPPRVTVTSLGGAHTRNGRPCWTISRLAAGRSRTLRLRVMVSGSAHPGTLTNTAKLTVADRAPQTARVRVRVIALVACPSTLRPSPIATAAC